MVSTSTFEKVERGLHERYGREVIQSMERRGDILVARFNQIPPRHARPDDAYPYDDDDIAEAELESHSDITELPEVVEMDYEVGGHNPETGDPSVIVYLKLREE